MAARLAGAPPVNPLQSEEAPDGHSTFPLLKTMQPLEQVRRKKPMPDDSTPTVSPAGSKHSVDPRTAMYATLLDSNRHAFARWLEGMFALSQEITQFTQTRLQEDMASWAALATCSSPEQAFDCQRRFAERLSEQYSHEISKLSRMMMSISSDGLSSLKQGSDGEGRSGPNREARR
jgi:hypothetical protein